MQGSVTWVFSEADDFQAALRAEGCLGLLVTGPGEFRARLTQVALRPTARCGHSRHARGGAEAVTRAETGAGTAHIDRDQDIAARHEQVAPACYASVPAGAPAISANRR
jgi:hypothetical protein